MYEYGHNYRPGQRKYLGGLDDVADTAAENSGWDTSVTMPTDPTQSLQTQADSLNTQLDTTPLATNPDAASTPAFADLTPEQISAVNAGETLQPSDFQTPAAYQAYANGVAQQRAASSSSNGGSVLESIASVFKTALGPSVPYRPGMPKPAWYTTPTGMVGLLAGGGLLVYLLLPPAPRAAAPANVAGARVRRRRAKRRK